MSVNIRLDADILDSPVFDDPPALRAFLYFLFKCADKQQEVNLHIGFKAKRVTVDRGQFLFQRGRDAKILDIAPSTLYAALGRLEDMGAVETQASNKQYTVVKIVRYESYAGDSEDDERPAAPTDPTPQKKIKEAWNKFANKHGLSPIRKLTDKRQRKLRIRWNEWREEGEPWRVFREICRGIIRSDFLMGEQGRWQVDFDFITKNDTNWIRILEGRYEDREPESDDLRLPGEEPL